MSNVYNIQIAYKELIITLNRLDIVYTMRKKSSTYLRIKISALENNSQYERVRLTRQNSENNGMNNMTRKYVTQSCYIRLFTHIKVLISGEKVETNFARLCMSMGYCTTLSYIVNL